MRPKIQQQAAPPPPVIEDTAGVQQDYQDKLRMRRGRASSILSERNQAAPMTAGKQLLGQ